ncbi:MAG: hypothetical protein LUG61_07835 [Lachnospiraceae bacterium]|nr:hypothetical protein [Lachnospiraceae bacterium]
MSTLIFLKLLSDLGLYYSIAGFFAVFAGADASLLLMSFGLQALAGFLTFPLREKGVIRFLPLLLLAVCFLLPGGWYVEWIAVMPPACYVIYLTVKRLYLPEWSAQIDIFRIFWKLLLGFCAMALLMGCGEQLAAITIPMGLITLTCCVILMRSLRHDASVYCTPRFQAMNLLTVAVVILLAAALSSDAFLNAVAAVLSWIYQTVCYPLLMVVLYLLVGIVRVIIWLFSWIQFGDSEQQETEMTLDLSGVDEVLGDTQTGLNSELFSQVMTALGLILAAVVLFFVFRWLSRRNRQSEGNAITGQRTTVERTSAGRRFLAISTPVEQVRFQYRKYLKLCRANGFDFEKSETSREIEFKTKKAMEAENVHAMREIYIKARYHEEATKEDVAEAKRLYQRLSASAKDKT